jgi:hypothetical protein
MIKPLLFFIFLIIIALIISYSSFVFSISEKNEYQWRKPIKFNLQKGLYIDIHIGIEGESRRLKVSQNVKDIILWNSMDNSAQSFVKLGIVDENYMKTWCYNTKIKVENETISNEDNFSSTYYDFLYKKQLELFKNIQKEWKPDCNSISIGDVLGSDKIMIGGEWLRLPVIWKSNPGSSPLFDSMSTGIFGLHRTSTIYKYWYSFLINKEGLFLGSFIQQNDLFLINLLKQKKYNQIKNITNINWNEINNNNNNQLLPAIYNSGNNKYLEDIITMTDENNQEKIIQLKQMKINFVTDKKSIDLKEYNLHINWDIKYSIFPDDIIFSRINNQVIQEYINKVNSTPNYNYNFRDLFPVTKYQLLFEEGFMFLITSENCWEQWNKYLSLLNNITNDNNIFNQKICEDNFWLPIPKNNLIIEYKDISTNSYIAIQREHRKINLNNTGNIVFGFNILRNMDVSFNYLTGDVLLKPLVSIDNNETLFSSFFEFILPLLYIFSRICLYEFESGNEKIMEIVYLEFPAIICSVFILFINIFPYKLFYHIQVFSGYNGNIASNIILVIFFYCLTGQILCYIYHYYYVKNGKTIKKALKGRFFKRIIIEKKKTNQVIPLQLRINDNFFISMHNLYNNQDNINENQLLKKTETMFIEEFKLPKVWIQRKMFFELILFISICSSSIIEIDTVYDIILLILTSIYMLYRYYKFYILLFIRKKFLSFWMLLPLTILLSFFVFQYIIYPLIVKITIDILGQSNSYNLIYSIFIMFCIIISAYLNSLIVLTLQINTFLNSTFNKK